MYIRTPPDMSKAEIMAKASEITNQRHGAANVHPMPTWKNFAQDIWHGALHRLGVHWYIYTEVFDLETGEIEPKGQICWLCPDELAALRRR